METFSALMALCAGNLTVIGEFPSQRPVTRNIDQAGDLTGYRVHYDVTVMLIVMHPSTFTFKANLLVATSMWLKHTTELMGLEWRIIS